MKATNKNQVNRANHKNQGSDNLPALRFPEFTGEWEKKRLGEVLKIGSGRDYKHLGEGDVPVFGTGGLMTMVDQYLYDGETVCIGRKGTIDKPMYFNGKIWTVDTLFYTHTFNESVPKFVYALFQRVNWKQHNEAGGVPSLAKSTIEQIFLNLPTLPEQKRIASFFTVLDMKFSELKHKKNLLEQYKKGVMQKLFCLNHDSLDLHDEHDFEKGNQEKKSRFRQLRFKDENGKEFPEWEKKKLGEVLSIPEKIKPDTIDKNKLMTVKLHLKGIFKNESTDGLSIGSTNYYVREEGQFIYGKQNLFNGAFGIIPNEFDGFLTSGDVPALDIDYSKLNSMYLLSYLGREIFYKKLEEIASGSGSKRIHENTLLNVEVPIPSLEEQTCIANFLSAIDEKINHTLNQIQQTQQYKKGLLQKMFV